MKALFRSIIKKISYLFASGIILVAVLVLAGRLLTPMIDAHRADIEQWASNVLKMPVSIGKAEFSWYHYQPGVILQSVTILGKDTKEPVLQIKSVRVFFSIPQSIWQRTLVPSGMLASGSDISLHQAANGEVSLQGFPALKGFNDKPYQHETKFADVMGWLSLQPRLILRDIDIRYTGFNGQKRFITLYHLNVQNDAQEHYIQGRAILHQDIPTEVSLAVQWHGDNYDPNKIRAKLYLYVSGLSLKQWAKDYIFHGWQINQGLASAKIWATWHKGSFKKIQSTYYLYGLDLYTQANKTSYKINRISGNIGWKQDQNSYVLAGDDILIDLPHHLWPVTNFYIAFAPNVKGVLSPKVANIGYLDLNDVQSLLLSSPPTWLPDTTRKFLLALKPEGSLDSLNITFSDTWDDWRHITFNTNFNQISLQAQPHYPGIENFSGKLKWNGTQADLTLNSYRSFFQYDDVFAKPLKWDQIMGDMEIKLDQNNAWQLQMSGIDIANNDMRMHVSGSLKSDPKQAAIADIKSDFSLQQANHITHYLPLKWFDASLVKWLQQAFLSGEVSAAQLQLKGGLNDFPYDHHEGTFIVSGIVDHVNLHYAPDWPDLNHIQGKIVFSGRNLSIDLDHADILNIPITAAHGEMPHLGGDGPQVLTVKSNSIQSDFTNGLHFIYASPLEETIGKMLDGMQLKGPLALQLSLAIPVTNPENTKVQGTIAMEDTKIALVPWDLKLDQVNGNFHFTEASISAEHITGRLFNKPIAFNLTTLQKTKDVSIVEAQFKNNFDLHDLQSWLKIPFTKVAQGATDVNTVIDFSLKEAMEIHLNSKLVGLSINLPDQFAKKPEEARDFSAEIRIPHNGPVRIKMNYASLLKAALILQHHQNNFNLYAANLHIGSGDIPWPQEAGINLSADFDTLTWDNIKNYSDHYSHYNQPSDLALHEIAIYTKKLELFGQAFSDVKLNILLHDNDKQVILESPDIIGKIQIPVAFTPDNTIIAQFQRLKLTKASPANDALQHFDLKSFPQLSFAANNVSYNDIPLGQVIFKTKAVENGLMIKPVRIFSSRVDLQAMGNWIQTGKNTFTRLQGIARSQHVNGLLTSLGLNAQNFISSTGKVNFNLAWDGAPFAPSLESLSGRASLDLGHGRIVDVGEAGGAKMGIGRMLSIFSLQTIPRRLSLDFSDLFQKGYSFDSLRGDFTFNQGNAFTNNFKLDGPVAGVAINGRIGLNEKDYDFMLSVTPHVTSSIPIAATLLTLNPIIGLAAFAANTVISPAVSQAVTHYYFVKGAWDNPVWQPVNR